MTPADYTSPRQHFFVNYNQDGSKLLTIVREAVALRHCFPR